MASEYKDIFNGLFEFYVDLGFSEAEAEAKALREAPDVPTMVIKAVGRDYEEVTDRDELGVFLPQVQFIKAKPSRTSKQNFLLELKSRNEKVTLMMTVRSSSGGKLKQFSLKVTYNGIVKWIL